MINNMHFFILVLIFCFLIFLFFLHFICRDDFILLRKNISLESVFNLAFLVSIAALLGARLFYVFYHPSTRFINPLFFFLFPYFPGLSLAGGIIGGVAFLYFFSRARKMPTGRLFDFFSTAFLSSLPIGLLGYFLLSRTSLISLGVLFSLFSYLILFFIFAFYLLPRQLKGRFSDGTLGFIFLFSFSLVSILTKVLSRSFYFGIDLITLFIIFVFSLSVLIKREKLINKVKKRFKK